MKKTIFLSIALLLAVSAAAECRTIILRADGSGDYPTIQEAIDDCNDGDIILLADGTYTGDGNRDIDFLGKAIMVKSENGPEDCVIDCNGTGSEPHRGFHFHSGEDANSVIAGLTITNGYAPLMPGHRTPVGGAIYCISSSPTIRQCVIRGNLAGVGGGIYCGESESIISNCEITGNSARYGGGIRLHTCQSEINNCLITDNTAWEQNGGGVIISWGDAAITNCTISNNVADRRISGGMYCDESTVTITNCIFWDNSPSEISEGPGGNATATYCDIKGGWPGEGNIEADPCFADANNGDYYLLTDSPCIDAGTDAGVYADIEGTERPFDYPGVDNNGDLPDFDIGAYEAHPYHIAVANIERAIAEKIEALERINAALERESEAYEALEVLLESGDYGDLKKGDIIRAEQKIHSAVQHQHQSIDTLEKSIGKLQHSLSALGCEVEPNQNND